MSSKTDILRKIEDLFYEKSFSDLTMDEIAAELGMKKASLYYHFPSKEAMFTEILEDSFARYREETLGNLRERSGSESPAELVRSLVEFASENRNLFAVASQKGYCRIDSVRERIAELKESLADECCGILRSLYDWNAARCSIFLITVEALAQRRCGIGCPDALPDEIASETAAVFFS